MHGQGRLSLPDGSKYVGQFENAKIHGAGKFFRADGSLEYDGQLKNEKKHGQGTETWRDGGKYIYENLNI